MENYNTSETRMPKWYLDKNSLYARYREVRSGQKIVLDYYPKIILTETQVHHFKGEIPLDKRSKTATKGQTRDKDIDARVVKVTNAIINVLKKIDPFRLTKKTFTQQVSKELNRKSGKYQSGMLKYLEDKLADHDAKVETPQKRLKYLISIIEQFNKSLTFEQLNNQVLDDIVEFLRNHPKEYSQNFIHQAMAELLAWTGTAYQEGIHLNDAYKGWERPKAAEVFNIFLTDEEIERIHRVTFDLTGDVVADYWRYNDYNCQAYKLNRSTYSHVKDESELREFIGDNTKMLGHLKKATKRRIKHLKECQALLVLGCWTGLRSANYLNINEKAVVRPDLKSLDIKTVKGGQIVTIPLHPLAREVFERAQHVSELVTKGNGQFNLVLPILGKLAGIDEPIIFDRTRGKEKKTKTLPKYMLIRSHTARRSLCSNLLILGFSEMTIMAISGHDDIGSFRKYTATVRKTDLIKPVFDHPIWA